MKNFDLLEENFSKTETSPRIKIIFLFLIFISTVICSVITNYFFAYYVGGIADKFDKIADNIEALNKIISIICQNYHIKCE